jgi:c-di-AMP phosphodiesterase-like protein
MKDFSRTKTYLIFIMAFIFLTTLSIISYFLLDMQITIKLVLTTFLTIVGMIFSRPRKGVRVKITPKHYINI